MNAAGQIRHQFQTHLRELLASMRDAVDGLPQGPRRLLVAVEAYWDACYASRQQRMAMIDAARDMALEPQLTRMAAIMLPMLGNELARCGVDDAQSLADALGPEIRAIARAELLTAHRLPSQRRRITRYIESRLDVGSDRAIAAA